jgi:hypothetical protein
MPRVLWVLHFNAGDGTVNVEEGQPRRGASVFKCFEVFIAAIRREAQILVV